MPRFLLHHRHQPAECAAAYAAWKGFDSPLRHRVAIGSCLTGGHEVWWDLEAADHESALELLPRYVAQRTDATRIARIDIP